MLETGESEAKGREEDLVVEAGAEEELMVQTMPFEAVVQHSPDGA
jgi:hypothetical protein